MRRATFRIISLALSGCLMSCAQSVGGSSGAPPAASASPLHVDDRVLVTDYSNIIGMAASARLVFAASPRGLGILDRQFGRWLPPLTRPGGFPDARVSILVGDPVEDAVWIGAAGSVMYYRPTLNQLSSATVPGVVDAIMFDRRDPGAGAYVLSGGQWSLATRTGFVTPATAAQLPPPAARIAPPTLRDLYREFPSLHSFGGLLTRDATLRSWPISAGTRAPDRTELWLGTAGNGIYRVDPVFNQSEHFPFGLLGAGASALALDAGGIWSAALGADAGARGGLTLASQDLQRWRWVEGPPERPLARARAHALIVRDGLAWIATDRGVMALETEGGEAREWRLDNGLPSDEALSLALAPGGAWVGTTRGLAFVTHNAGARPGAERRTASEAASAPIAFGAPVRALLLAGDTLWVGSDAGLLLLAPAIDTSRPWRPSAASADRRLTRPVRALAASDTVLAVATADELVLVHRSSGRPMAGPGALDLRPLRGVTALAMDIRTIWLTGVGGLVVVSRATGVSRFLPSPGEMPGEVYDVGLTRDYAWLATHAGLLRLRRLPDGTLP